MKFVCPHCMTEHSVPDGAISPAGRVGKCAFCGGRVRVMREGAIKEELPEPAGAMTTLPVPPRREAPAEPIPAPADEPATIADPELGWPESSPAPAAEASPAEPETGASAPPPELGEDTLPAPSEAQAAAGVPAAAAAPAAAEQQPNSEELGAETVLAIPAPGPPPSRAAEGSQWEMELPEEDDFGPVIGLAKSDDDELPESGVVEYQVDLLDHGNEIYDFEGLKKLVEAGTLHADHFIAKRHSNEWFLADELEGLF